MSKKGKAQSIGSLWSDIDNIYVHCCQLYQSAAQVTPVLRNRDLHDHVSNMDELTKLSQILAKDVREFKTSLEEIHSRHAGNKGACANGDVLIHLLDVHEQYLNWIERYQNTAIPIIEQILKIGRNAANSPASQTALAQASDAPPQHSLPTQVQS
jgi:elongation factor P--beta-lysine ligase